MIIDCSLKWSQSAYVFGENTAYLERNIYEYEVGIIYINMNS